jgi:glycosidase
MQTLIMTPGTGERALRFVGDRIRFTLSQAGGGRWPEGWCAFLRTSLGRASVLRQEIIKTHSGRLREPDAFWHDLPMRREENDWSIELSLTEPGHFRSKAYALDARGRQHWPEGPDFGLSVHPNAYRSGNTIYCAFVRMFGASRTAVTTHNRQLERLFSTLDKDGFTVIPPSGKLRDLVRQLPHIIDTLGCRILHLLPVNPTPTTYARMGRFGSPYAVQDLMAVDPALVEFDRSTTGIDQFCELTYAVHLRGGRVFLDIVINHTGWGSREQETHPEWYLRDDEGAFVSPGAWGVTWEDLTEFDHRNPELWEYLAEVFLTWCRRGVDGFRCDAGYKVPIPAWQYITARVLEEFPDTIFLLEGLGGPWQATEALLTEGGMQWAYSELFQNYSGRDVAGYLDYSLRQSERSGLYVHYSETHDNDRLARQGRVWSLLRNRLCALTSVSGGFGFTCGVERLASEKIQVHQSRGLSWGSDQNILRELAQLNHLVSEHPCFLDGAKLTRLSPADSPVYALRRESAEGLDRLLVLVNNDAAMPQTLALGKNDLENPGELKFELLGQPLPRRQESSDGRIEYLLPPGAAYCLAASSRAVGLGGNAYRRARAQSAWAVAAVRQTLLIEAIGPCDWRILAGRVDEDPKGFLATLTLMDPAAASADLLKAIQSAPKGLPQVVDWHLPDRKRITPVPPGHWLLLYDDSTFRAVLSLKNGQAPRHVESIPVRGGHVATFPPLAPVAASLDADLTLERYTKQDTLIQASIRFLSAAPAGPRTAKPVNGSLALLTNGRGGMVRIRTDLGTVQSKYDCVLGANLHGAVPVDRHVFLKRMRVWVNADGFITPLDMQQLIGAAKSTGVQEVI